MKKDHSYGIIPLDFRFDAWHVLMVQHHAGHWAFPKGHAENKETPQQAAERELLEETGLTIKRFLSPHLFQEKYFFHFKGALISKTVDYFAALVEGSVILQEKEIQSSQWITLEEAFEKMTFKEGKKICLQVAEFLKAVDTNGNSFLASE